MATFDRERREIVVRIVYDGPATAGKTANLRSLFTSFGHRARGELTAPAETEAGRTAYFDSLELLAGHVGEWPLRCQLFTVPGQFVFAERRYRLLQGVDAIVMVCESTPQGMRAARGTYAFLLRALAPSSGAAVPIVVQANKQDLPGALSPAAVGSLLRLAPGQKVFPASALAGDGVRETLLATLKAARDVVRARLEHEPPEALDPPIGSAAMYAAMLRDGDASTGPVNDAIDAAIAELAILDGLTPGPPRTKA